MARVPIEDYYPILAEYLGTSGRRKPTVWSLLCRLCSLEPSFVRRNPRQGPIYTAEQLVCAKL